MDDDSFNFRTELSKEQRILDLDFTIDPGFVHRRLIETIIPPEAFKFIIKAINDLPDKTDFPLETIIDHIYTRHFIAFCKIYKIPTLRQAINEQRGRITCSTEELLPNRKFYKDLHKDSQTISKWRKPKTFSINVEFHYSAKKVTSDTLKMQLAKGDYFSIIAKNKSYDRKTLIMEPIIMGAPWLNNGDSNPDFDSMWYAHSYYENFIEDFDEFTKVTDFPIEHDFSIMKNITEKAFKKCLAIILKDDYKNDWGGETSDHFTSNIHINGKRMTGAFLLKGPSKFMPMNLNHLGKNNDQIVRLSNEPADVLFVQHCHNIESSVRTTLRAFAVQPSNVRRYCLIDGKDSLRLLKAYDLLNYAIDESNN